MSVDVSVGRSYCVSVGVSVGVSRLRERGRELAA